MLNVPQKADHALALMRHLALRHEAKLPLSLEEVAQAEGISQGYLEEVARLLRSANLVEGRRGAHGGYVLTREPQDITVADVVTAIEGHKWTAECLGESKRARAGANDALWRKVQGQVMTMLRGMTLADIAVAQAEPAAKTV